MSLPVESALVLMALLLALRGRRRLAASAAGLALVWLLGVGLTPLPQWMAGRLQNDYPAKESSPWLARNAIILLGAGTAVPPDGGAEASLVGYARIARAATLYGACHRTGNDCKVLVSGGDPMHHGAAEADVYAEVLRGLGVPQDDLIIERRSNSTWQNAQFSRPLLQAYAPLRMVLVTSALHLRRSQLYFAHFGLYPQPVRGDYVHAAVSWLPLARNADLFDAALHEYMGIARYYVYNALGWNAPREPPLEAH